MNKILSYFDIKTNSFEFLICYITLFHKTYKSQCAFVQATIYHRNCWQYNVLNDAKLACFLICIELVVAKLRHS